MAILAATLVVVSPLWAVAAPSNPVIQEAKRDAADARAKMDDLADDFSEAVEEYDAINVEIDETRASIEQANADLVIEDERLAENQARLADRVWAMYTSGNVSAIEVLLGTNSFEDFISRLRLLTLIGEADARVVSGVKTARARVAETGARLEARQSELVALRMSADAKRREVEQALARQKEFVNSLDDKVARLIREEEERQARLAAERAARLRARLEAARRARDAAEGGGRTTVDPTQFKGGASEIVDIAVQYLGVPYVWGGSTPDGFDCSGLTQYVYREAGVSIPRTSRQQFASGVRIPEDRLDLMQPGDLVFFGRDGDPGRVHHVGIYCGNGEYLHAPQAGDVVRISSLTERIESRDDYVGGSRY